MISEKTIHHLAIKRSNDIDDVDEIWAMKDNAIIWTGTSKQFRKEIDNLAEKGMDTLVLHPAIWELWKETGDAPILIRDRLN